jgi:hypothetical protein
MARVRPLRLTFTALALFVFAAPLLTGCGPPKTVAEIVTELRDPSAGKREDAAADLQTDDGVPVQAIPALLQAARIERDADSLGVMLMTLGKSGVPEARPLIDQFVFTASPKGRRRAGRALQYSLVANGRMAPDAELPKHWPYRQPSYPPFLPEQDSSARDFFANTG